MSTYPTTTQRLTALSAAALILGTASQALGDSAELAKALSNPVAGRGWIGLFPLK